MSQEEPKHTYPFEMDKSIIKSAEDTLSYAFEIGYE